MKVLGVSAFYHDSAAVLVDDGEIVAAAQEERFTRIKNDSGFPEKAVAFCLERGGIGLDDVDYVAFTTNRFCSLSGCLKPICLLRRGGSSHSQWPCLFGSARSYFRSNYCGTS
jgi:predicted NodU family carbamoyl transferase